MFPEKYLKDLESSRRRLKLFQYLFAGLLFVLSFLFTGPLIHEFSHALWLEFHNCFYDMSLEFRYIAGLRGKIDPGCNLNSSALVVFYSIGYFNTLLIGTLIDLYGRATDGKHLYLSTISIGILISVLASIGLKGDLQSAAKVLEAPSGTASIVAIFISLGIISLTYKTVKDFEN